MEQKKNLIICRVGDTSLHKQWLDSSGTNNYDLLINYYGDEHNKYINDANVYVESKGTKWPAIYQIIKSMQDEIFKYDAVWIPDDDLSTDSHNINNMFDIFSKAELLLAQPSLTTNSYYSHYITIKNDKLLLRFTNFAEVMAPIFSRDALQKCWQTFNKSLSGWGLDVVWPSILDNKRIGIIDETPVFHTRPRFSGTIYKESNINPEDDIVKLAKEYSIELPYKMKVFGGLVMKKDTHYQYIAPGILLAYKLIFGMPYSFIKKKSFLKYIKKVIFAN